MHMYREERWDWWNSSDQSDIGGSIADESAVASYNPSKLPDSSEYSWWDSMTGKGGTAAQKGAFGVGQLGLGAANFGLGLASYFQQSDMYKKQGKVMDQQIASNDYNMAAKKNFDHNFGNA